MMRKELSAAAEKGDRPSLIYKNVLDSMDEGVMTVGSDGRVKTFNLAASRMLGLSPEEVLRKAYAEVFLAVEGMEDFNEAVVAAIYDKGVGQRQVLKVQPGGVERTFALTTSYFQEDKKDGKKERKFGVTAVFSDITETEKLREAELRLTESVKAQHVELQTAYREMEESNQALSTALKKVQVARVSATVFVIVVFLASGLYVWNTDSQSLAGGDEIPSPVAFANPAPAGDLPTVTVVPQRLVSKHSFSGQLTPLREMSVVSPVSGKVAETHFEYGARVAAGQRLIVLDTTEAEQKYREAQAEHIEALKHFEEIRNWGESHEVLRSRRQIQSAKLALEEATSKLDETAFLLEMGIIPASEHEAAKRRRDTQLTTYEASLQDLKAVLARGGGDARKVARLKLDNARERMQALEATLNRATIKAPVTGVVLKPKAASQYGAQGENNSGLVVRGRTVTQGGLLLTIGDLNGLSVTGQVDEVDVAKIKVGQKALISGDAFPDLEMEGEIVNVSSQASVSLMGGGVPVFEVTAAVQDLDEEQWRRLRLGMSANIVVVVWEKPEALLVPFAVLRKEGGRYWVSVRRGEGGAIEPVPVEIGMTTVDKVEILSGLKAGDKVVAGR